MKRFDDFFFFFKMIFEAPPEGLQSGGASFIYSIYRRSMLTYVQELAQLV